MKKWHGVALMAFTILLIAFWPHPSIHAQGTTHGIALSWSAPTSGSPVTSYNVYRGGTTGGPYTKIANTANVTYLDTVVVGGQTYFYVVTSVGTTGLESAPSNEASATFLAPPAPPSGLKAVSN